MLSTMRHAERPCRIPLSRSRRLTIDVLHYHRQVPICAHDRVMDLSRLQSARSQLARRISWSMLFIKAYGMVSTKYPVLRQTYMRWPLPHIYQHPYSVAMMATSREFEGESWLFWSRFTRPEASPLAEMQRSLEKYQTEPIQKVFQRQWQLSGLPTPLRRTLWWWTLNISGVKRAKRSGTFFMSTIAGKRAEIQLPPAFLTSNITYGPLDDRGRARVTIAYDHRLMDGALIADCLADLDKTLNGPILDELRELLAVQQPVPSGQARLSA